MRCGDRKSFAVEFDLDENYNGAWLYGKFCYWISGIQVGDYELGTSLRDVLFQMKWVVHDCGNRDGGVLCGLRSQEVFSMLDGSLYSSGECETEIKVQLPDTPARFDITIPVDIFNQWKIYLLECDDEAKILFKNIDDTDIKVVSIATGTFDNVIKDAYYCLSRLYDKEVVSVS